MLVSVSFRLYDTDAWEHLAVGRAIWRDHVWPLTNTLTWPTYGAPLVNPSWGFSLLVWPFWAAGGVTGLFAWRWLTTLAVFALSWLTARRLGARGLSVLVTLVVASLIYRQRSQLRPETIAAVWLALTIWILETRRGGGPDRSVWLVAIAWGWANTHLSYYLGFVLIAMHAAFVPMRRRQLVLIALVCAAVSFVNPYGWHSLARPFEFALFWRNDPMFLGVAELKALDWSRNLWNGLPLFALGWPLLMARRWMRGRRDPIEAAMCAVFTVLYSPARLSRRHDRCGALPRARSTRGSPSGAPAFTLAGVAPGVRECPRCRQRALRVAASESPVGIGFDDSVCRSMPAIYARAGTAVRRSITSISAATCCGGSTPRATGCRSWTSIPRTHRRRCATATWPRSTTRPRFTRSSRITRSRGRC